MDAETESRKHEKDGVKMDEPEKNYGACMAV